MVFGYELWEGHLKEVEGNFGTAVVSYFIFLRWLFLMNLIIFLMWFGLVVIPQLVWVAGTNAPRTPSQLSCVFDANRTTPHICPEISLVVCVGEEEEEERFSVRECGFDEGENGTRVARRENRDKEAISVSRCNVTRSAHIHGSLTSSTDAYHVHLQWR